MILYFICENSIKVKVQFNQIDKNNLILVKFLITSAVFVQIIF